MNFRNDWAATLEMANKDLKKYGMKIRLLNDLDEGVYSCDIHDGFEWVNFADNYYEQELGELVNDAWEHARAKAKAKGEYVTNKNGTMEKYKATIIFGEYAAKAYCNGGVEEMAEHMDEGQLTVREFDTEAERRAYIMGIDDSDGWLGAAVLSKEDAECETVKKLLDE